MNKKISAITLISITEKKSNKGREVVSEDDVFLMLRDPWLSELNNLDPKKTFFATEEFRFFRTKEKKTVFQRCYKNVFNQIFWEECEKVFLVEQGEDE